MATSGWIRREILSMPMAGECFTTKGSIIGMASTRVTLLRQPWWALLAMLPCVGLISVGTIITVTTNSNVLLVLTPMILLVCYVLLFSVLLVKLYQYSQMIYMIVDNPKISAKKALNLSIKITKGYKKKSFFIAQEFEKLTDKQLATGEDRVVAQVKLEAYVLGLILLGCPFSAFDTDEKHWFWQSSNNKKLIIQREWFSKE